MIIFISQDGNIVLVRRINYAISCTSSTPTVGTKTVCFVEYQAIPIKRWRHHLTYAFDARVYCTLRSAYLNQSFAD